MQTCTDGCRVFDQPALGLVHAYISCIYLVAHYPVRMTSLYHVHLTMHTCLQLKQRLQIAVSNSMAAFSGLNHAPGYPGLDLSR